MDHVSEALDLSILPVTPFAQNCSIVKCRATGKGAVIDPGGDIARIRAAIAESDVDIVCILLTHGHADHAGATAALARELEVPVVGPQEDDRFWLDSLPHQASAFGMEATEACTPDRWLADGDSVSVGELELDVIHCPGHTPGHVVFHHAPSHFCVVGDVLFRGSIGRTDFPKGDHDTLIRSIKSKLLPLGDEVTFLPGHGPTSTLGVERRTNPFLTASR